MRPHRTHLLVATLLTASLFLAVSTALAGGTKVEICHIPPGNPGNFHTIKVNVNALSAHLGHGDIGSACDANCATLCDDGDACTSDDNFDCEQVGCPAARDAVDCNDSNPCTTDSCDSTEGCRTEAVTCTAPDACTVSMCAPDTGACVDAPVQCDAGQECNLDSGQCEDTGGSVCDDPNAPTVTVEGVTITPCENGGTCNPLSGQCETVGCNAYPISLPCDLFGYSGCCPDGTCHFNNNCPGDKWFG